MNTQVTNHFSFFFSSRRRHTRYWRDWSSDVCSSDLGGIDFLGNFGEAASGFGDLRRTNGLFVGGGADLLRELVDFGDHVGNLVQRGAKIVSEGQAFLDDARAALHVFDRLAGFALNALNEVRNFLG